MQTTFDTVTQAERKLALMAHGSIILTFVITMTTGGIGCTSSHLSSLFHLATLSRPITLRCLPRASSNAISNFISLLVLGLNGYRCNTISDRLGNYSLFKYFSYRVSAGTRFGCFVYRCRRDFGCFPASRSCLWIICNVGSL